LTIFNYRQFNDFDVITNSETKDGKRKEIQTSLELRKARRTSLLCSKLLTEAEITSESAVLLIPLSDGPLGAVLTIIELTKGGANFDEVIPVYLENANDYSKAQLLCTQGIDKLISSDRTLPISTTYEGGSGETLLNSVDALTNLCKQKYQFAANVRIQTTRFIEIQSTLDQFGKLDRLDFGYTEDSISSFQAIHHMAFPGSWDIGKEGEIENKTRAYLKQLLSLQGKFIASPLRSVEVVRALIIGGILSHGFKGVTYTKLFRSLDPVYNALNDFKSASRLYRNDITKKMVDSMINCRMIEREGTLLKACKDGWSSKSDLIDVYLSFYNLCKTS